MQPRSPLLLIALLLTAVPAMAQGFTATPWQDAGGARVRLIIPDAPKGATTGAIEVVLPAGAKTYWRTPGDTGVPTMADFSGSTGAVDVALQFPAPVAFDDGVGGVAYGYLERVTFPVTFRAETAAPLLAVDLAFGICTKSLCLPAQAKLTLAAATGQADSALTNVVRVARDAVPRALPLAGQGPLAITETTWNDTAKPPKLTVRTRVPAGLEPSLFAEGDTAVSSRLIARTGDTAEFALSFDRPDRPRGGSILLTLVAGREAVETKLDLDGVKKAP